MTTFTGTVREAGDLLCNYADDAHVSMTIMSKKEYDDIQIDPDEEVETGVEETDLLEAIAELNSTLNLQLDINMHFPPGYPVIPIQLPGYREPPRDPYHPCDGCSNNPINGGTGICHCTLPYMHRERTNMPPQRVWTTSRIHPDSDAYKI